MPPRIYLCNAEEVLGNLSAPPNISLWLDDNCAIHLTQDISTPDRIRLRVSLRTIHRQAH